MFAFSRLSVSNLYTNLSRWKHIRIIDGILVITSQVLYFSILQLHSVLTVLDYLNMIFLPIYFCASQKRFRPLPLPFYFGWHCEWILSYTAVVVFVWKWNRPHSTTSWILQLKRGLDFLISVRIKSYQKGGDHFAKTEKSCSFRFFDGFHLYSLRSLSCSIPDCCCTTHPTVS